MNASNYQNESSIKGDSDEDTVLLQSMAINARKYLSNFNWCPQIKTIYFADGIGGVIAVFLVELDNDIDLNDKFLWVIVGDLPSAYLVTDDIQNPRQALISYCEIMNDWIKAVMSNKGIENTFPVPIEPTKVNAQFLANRLAYVRENILPSF
jgi:hypothetical protein